jgi:hypothetical protein
VPRVDPVLVRRFGSYGYSVIPTKSCQCRGRGLVVAAMMISDLRTDGLTLGVKEISSERRGIMRRLVKLEDRDAETR